MSNTYTMRALINLFSGGPYTSVVQKPGRLAEIRLDIGTPLDLMFDITFVPNFYPSYDSMPDQG